MQTKQKQSMLFPFNALLDTCCEMHSSILLKLIEMDFMTKQV